MAARVYDFGNDKIRESCARTCGRTSKRGILGGDRGNVFIEPKGGFTVPAGKNGVDTHTLYPNGSNYNRYNPIGHGNNSIPHGHGHLMGTGYGRKGQGSSIDALGNVVPFNSSDAHWTIY